MLVSHDRTLHATLACTVVGPSCFYAGKNVNSLQCQTYLFINCNMDSKMFG